MNPVRALRVSQPRRPARILRAIEHHKLPSAHHHRRIERPRALPSTPLRQKNRRLRNSFPAGTAARSLRMRHKNKNPRHATNRNPSPHNPRGSHISIYHDSRLKFPFRPARIPVQNSLFVFQQFLGTSSGHDKSCPLREITTRACRQSRHWAKSVVVGAGFLKPAFLALLPLFPCRGHLLRWPSWSAAASSFSSLCRGTINRALFVRSPRILAANRATGQNRSL